MSETLKLPSDPGAYPDTPHRTGLVRFLGLALAVHAFVLWAWQTDTPPAAPAGDRQPLSVALVVPEAGLQQGRPTTRPASQPPAPAHPTAQTQPRPPAPAAASAPTPPEPGPPAASGLKTGPPSQTSTRPKTAHRSGQQQTAAGDQLPPPPEPGDAARPVTWTAPAGTTGAEQPPAAGRDNDRLSPAEARTRLRRALRLALARHFRYPSIARRRGWQGTVRVGVRIEPDGQLSRIRLMATSGYGVLDHNALGTLERVGALPEAVRWLGGRHFDMVLPVQYRLVEG